jgi:hypothetical protein
MSKRESKVCPRCKAEFECKSGSVMLCQCQGIVLSEGQQDYIKSLYTDCLCITCLHELRAEHDRKQCNRQSQ